MSSRPAVSRGARRLRASVAGCLVVAVAGCAGSGGDPSDAPGVAIVQVVLGRHRDQAALDRTAIAVNDPASDDDGTFLTVAAIATEYGASAATAAGVQEYVASQPQRVLIDAASSNGS